MPRTHDFTATQQIGIVAECDDSKHAVRVRLPALEDMLTDWLPVIVANAGSNRFYALPDPNEQVVCMLDARGEGGVVLGAIYNSADPTPASNRDIWCKQFTNGTRVEHNRATGQVTVDTPGNVLIKAGGKVTIDCAETETTGNLLVSGSLTYMQGMTGFGGSSGGATAKINGSLEATNDVKAGNISLGTHDHQSGVGQPT
ncbi:MAG: phage baseplate assembly protein V [Burkholderiaceae bacterium]